MMDAYTVLIRSGTSQDWSQAFKQAKGLKQPIKPLYHAYLQSECWAKKREWVLGTAGHKCQVCRKVQATQVHHLNYDRCGSEHIEDLQAICRDCHKAEHPKADGMHFASKFERSREWSRRKQLEYAMRSKRIDPEVYAKAMQEQKPVTELAAMVARAMPKPDYTRLYVEEEIPRDLAREPQ